jgi:hypothetical protein
MFGHQYNHGVIRKYIIMFGNMFNDLVIVRNKGNTEVQKFSVPIAYGPREKFLARLNQDPNLDRQVAIQLPRFSFEITAMSYASTRTLNKTIRNTSTNTDASKKTSQFTPVPYDFNISLYGMFSNNEDAVQAVEQILPFFRPEWTHSMRLIDSMNDYYDIPTVMESMTIEDSYEQGFTERRALIYTFNFVVKGYIFGPVTNKGIIKRTILDFYPDTDLTTKVQKKIDLTPGLLANGSPTSNSSASVAASLINSDDNYGYAFDSEEFFNTQSSAQASAGAAAPPEPEPEADPADYTINVTNNGSSNYVISGTDRTGSVSGDNATLNFNVGDIVDFVVNASGHPFYIKTDQSTGLDNQASNVTNNGADVDTIRWVVPSDYSGSTLYYNCFYHASMRGAITIN